MELGALVAEALLAGAESAEVLGGLGDNIVEELEVDAAGLLLDGASRGDVALAVNLDLGASVVMRVSNRQRSMQSGDDLLPLAIELQAAVSKSSAWQ